VCAGLRGDVRRGHPRLEWIGRALDPADEEATMRWMTRVLVEAARREANISA
jgi:hypothetical protein